jgi:AraC-like DNA-binding protein/mannose-6-phosphate isomerase-like protein (cupin superfamily)
MVAKTGLQIDLSWMPLVVPQEGRQVWADIERFGIDELIAADAASASAVRPRSFAVQVPELTSIGVHWHDYYELGCVLEGHAAHVVNGQVLSVAPGSVFLLSPADFHAIEPSGAKPLLVVNAVLDPHLVERTLESVLPVGDLRLPWSVPALPGAAEDVSRIWDETLTRRPGWDVVVDAALRALVVELARACLDHEQVGDDESERAGPPAHVHRALRYVERHFREPLTLGQVAAVAHLSPHWFSEQFRRATGDSFQSYLKRRRLQFARALLDSTELGVTEVAHASGFNDPSYFGRAYRRQYGVSPSGRTARPVNGQRPETNP